MHTTPTRSVPSRKFTVTYPKGPKWSTTIVGKDDAKVLAEIAGRIDRLTKSTPGCAFEIGEARTTEMFGICF